ncbi:MAG: TetR/AcrR family transcriptional regulator [Eubacterium sp.]|jgi:AcrR family transcriptional regulator|nr:TetR/AcrR family transcriptional regulator [Eubacterium sp.]
MSVEKKRMFVEKAYEIIKEEGAENVKIRRVAEEMHCTSTVIYRYFENVQHLIALASIKFLGGYLAEFQKLTSDPELIRHPYQLNLKLWDCLAKHAFKDIVIYENLFFGEYSDSLGEIIFEYYQLFLNEEEQKFDGYATSILFNDDIVQRDLVLLRRAAAVGVIDMKDSEAISNIEAFVFHGVLLKYKSRDHEPGIAEKSYREFMDLLYNIADKYSLRKKH